MSDDWREYPDQELVGSNEDDDVYRKKLHFWITWNEFLLLGSHDLLGRFSDTLPVAFMVQTRVSLQVDGQDVFCNAILETRTRATFIIDRLLSERGTGEEKRMIYRIFRNTTKTCFVLKECSILYKKEFVIQAILGTFDHPHVLKILHYFETGPRIYAVLPYATTDLSNYIAIRRGAVLQEAELLDYLSQMSSALNHLFKLGIVHCDVSCDNFLIMPDGSLKLADFGWAHLVTDIETRFPGPYGKHSYMAPELFSSCLEKGSPGFDPFAADIWSLGVCALMMTLCTSRPLWHVPTPTNKCFMVVLRSYKGGVSYLLSKGSWCQSSDVLSRIETLLIINPNDRKKAYLK